LGRRKAHPITGQPKTTICVSFEKY
jgi:hypothetical protein